MLCLQFRSCVLLCCLVAFSFAFHVLARCFEREGLLPSMKKAFLGVVSIIGSYINKRIVMGWEPLEFRDISEISRQLLYRDDYISVPAASALNYKDPSALAFPHTVAKESTLFHVVHFVYILIKCCWRGTEQHTIIISQYSLSVVCNGRSKKQESVWNKIWQWGYFCNRFVMESADL